MEIQQNLKLGFICGMELLLVKIRKFRKKPNCSLEQKPPRRSGELTAEGGSAQLSRSAFLG